MIVAYADASMDNPICSVGYVLFRSEMGDEEFLDAGTRLLNINECQRDIDWTVQKAEYWGAIIATRAALDYDEDTLLLHLDDRTLIPKIRDKEWDGESYFHDTFRSFANRFNNWHLSLVHRDNNTAAHKQARIGLQVGRDLREGVL